MSRLLRKFAFCSKTDTETRPSSEVECAVCQDPPTKPCTVPCGNGHVFCQACLQGLITHNHYTSHFPCPLCRTRVRIPLGGVAVFRQGKGVRSRVLARLPALRPRCRRRSSMDSLSSGWPGDMSLSDFDRWGDQDVEPAYQSGSDDDYGDADEVSLEGVVAEPGTEFSAERRELDSWLNSLDPEQVMILEEINRQRAQAERLEAEQADPVSRALEVLDQAVLLQGTGSESANDADEADRGDSSSLRSGGRDGSVASTEEADDPAMQRLPDILSDSEDLDMTVVLQMIADIENGDEQDSCHNPSLDTEDGETSGTVPDPSFSETVDDTGERSGDHSPPGSLTQRSALSAHRDWKLRTIASATIPRPKLTFACGMPGERRFGLYDEEEEHLERVGAGRPELSQQVSTDSSTVEEEEEKEVELPPQLEDLGDTLEEEEEEEEVELPPQLEDLGDTLEEEEGKRVGWTERQACAEQNTSPEPPSDPDGHRERSSHHSPGLSFPTQTEVLRAILKKHGYVSSVTVSQHPVERNLNAGSLNLADPTDRTPAEGDPPSGLQQQGEDFPPPPCLPPQYWDLPEPAETPQLRRMAADILEDDNLPPDTQGVVREGSSGWIRRIRSL